MKFTIISRTDPYSDNLSASLKKILIQDYAWETDEDNPELVICIGGDGTLLRAIHQYLDLLDQVLFTAVHTGTLGFFTDYTNEQIPQFIEDITQKPYTVETSPLLKASLDDGRQVYALNEIRLGSFNYTVAYDVYINGEFFEQTNGSGICICTQAGSTAANRALNGAVVDSGLSIMEMTEIMPVSHNNHHSLTSPYIMRDDRTVTVHGQSIQVSELSYDYLYIQDLEKVKMITISMSDKRVRFARYRPYSYLARLKNLY